MCRFAAAGSPLPCVLADASVLAVLLDSALTTFAFPVVRIFLSRVMGKCHPQRPMLAEGVWGYCPVSPEGTVRDNSISAPIALLPLALYPISWLRWIGLLFTVLVYVSPVCGVDGVGWALEGRLLQ